MNCIDDVLSGVACTNIPPPPPSPVLVLLVKLTAESVATREAPRIESPPPLPDSAALATNSLDVRFTHPPWSTATPPPKPEVATLPTAWMPLAESSVLRPRKAPPPAPEAALPRIVTLVSVRNVSRSVLLPGSSDTIRAPPLPLVAWLPSKVPFCNRTCTTSLVVHCGGGDTATGVVSSWRAGKRGRRMLLVLPGAQRTPLGVSQTVA